MTGWATHLCRSIGALPTRPPHQSQSAEKEDAQPALRRPRKGDFVERLAAEFFAGTCDRLAAQSAIEQDRRLIVLQGPDNQALDPALRQIAAHRREQATAIT